VLPWRNDAEMGTANSTRFGVIQRMQWKVCFGFWFGPSLCNFSRISLSYSLLCLLDPFLP